MSIGYFVTKSIPLIQICCPLNAVPTTQPPVVQTPKPRTTEIQGRLLTSDEGCGISNETHTRIVGGEPAKLGMLRTSIANFTLKVKQFSE